MRAPSAQLKSRQALVKRMREQDRTQASLARLIGRTKQFVQQLASGSVATCSAETAFRIEEALQVPAGTFFMRVGEPVTRKSSVSRTDSAA